LGQYSRLAHDPIQAALDARFQVGPFVRFRIGPKPSYFVFDPKDVRNVLLDNAQAYGKTTRGYDVLRLVLGDGLVTSDGDHWLRQRRIAQPAFCRDALSHFADMMVRASVDLVERWQVDARANQEVDIARL